MKMWREAAPSEEFIRKAEPPPSTPPLPAAHSFSGAKLGLVVAASLRGGWRCVDVAFQPQLWASATLHKPETELLSNLLFL